MKWEWLLSRQVRFPWPSSSRMYSAGKPPWDPKQTQEGRESSHILPRPHEQWVRRMGGIPKTESWAQEPENVPLLGQKVLIYVVKGIDMEV